MFRIRKGREDQKVEKIKRSKTFVYISTEGKIPKVESISLLFTFPLESYWFSDKKRIFTNQKQFR